MDLGLRLGLGWKFEANVRGAESQVCWTAKATRAR